LIVKSTQVSKGENQGGGGPKKKITKTLGKGGVMGKETY